MRPSGQGFHRFHPLPGDGRKRQIAGRNGLAFHNHDAGPAFAGTASKPCALEAKNLAQNIQKRNIPISPGPPFDAVHIQRNVFLAGRWVHILPARRNMKIADSDILVSDPENVQHTLARVRPSR